MSSCFTWVSISGLGEPNIYHDLGNFTRKWEVSGGCLTVRISGSYSQEMIGLVLFLKSHSTLFSSYEPDDTELL